MDFLNLDEQSTQCVTHTNTRSEHQIITRRKQQCHSLTLTHNVQDQISWNQYQFNDVEEKQSVLLLF